MKNAWNLTICLVSVAAGLPLLAGAEGTAGNRKRRRTVQEIAARAVRVAPVVRNLARGSGGAGS